MKQAFNPGDQVTLKARRDLIGTIRNEQPRQSMGERSYPVVFHDTPGSTRWCQESDLEPYLGNVTPEELFRQQRFGPHEALVKLLTAYRILHPLTNVYLSMFASRTDFLPYQFRPLVRLLNADHQRLLIADEVGLGKTIEAGLILQELAGRQTMDRVLVVCKKNLITKWYEELGRKFGERFEKLDGGDLRNWIEENPTRGYLSRLRGIVGLETLRSERCRQAVSDTPLGLNLLIVDEAHHLRNSRTKSHRVIQSLANDADSILFLTATPIQTNQENLFSLLSILLPDEFFDHSLFGQQMQQNRGVLNAIKALRSRDWPALASAVNELKETGLCSATELQMERTLDHDKVREMERRLVELSPLSHVFTRTRKCDVLEKPITRRAHTYSFRYNDAEMEKYRAALGEFRNDLQGRGAASTVTWGSQMRLRQVASCMYSVPARVEGSREEDSNGFDAIDEFHSDTDDPEINASAMDTKYEELRKVLHHVPAQSKVVIFSYFRGTLSYLSSRLTRDGQKNVQIHGGIPSFPNDPEKDVRGKQYREFRRNPDIRILLTSEVSSEGVDLEFCDYLVNYDLPWNPMAVEQRIGRLDRHGQQSDVVHILNLVAEDTIEEKILLRLYERIRLFEESIGDIDVILGDTVPQLLENFFAGELTDAEFQKRSDDIARVVQAQIAEKQQLERKAPEFFALDSYVEEEINRAKDEGRYVSPQNVQMLLTEYLDRETPRSKLVSDADHTGIWVLEIGDDLRKRIMNAGVDLEPEQVGRLKSAAAQGQLALAFDPTLIDRNDTTIELVTPGHALIRMVCKDLWQKHEQLHPVSKIETRTTLPVPTGWYSYGLFSINLMGVGSRTFLEPVVVPPTGAQPLENDLANRLLSHVMLNGKTLPTVPDDVRINPDECLNRMMMALEERRRVLRECFENTENAVKEHRRRVVEQSSRAKVNRKEQLLNQARVEDRPAHYIRMLKGEIEHLQADASERLDKLDSSSVSETWEIIGLGVVHIL